ncbi:MAG: FkbM family methyltransferase [Thermoanaerobaculia bacterium]
MPTSEKPRPLINNRMLLGLVLVVLVIEVVRFGHYFRSLPAQTAASPSASSAVPPSATPPQETPNAVPYRDRTLRLDLPIHRVPRGPARPAAAELLAPRLLDDQRETADYLGAFPISDYHIADVPTDGRFYIDDLPDLIKTKLDRGHVWEPQIVQIIGQFALPGTTAIDAGAHIGTHTVTLSKAVGATGLVYAFEPQKKLYRELVHNLQLNDAANVTALRFALGAEPGVIEMDAANDANEGGTAVGQGGDPAEVRTVDSFELDHVSFIKIDVEGFETPVLKGARRTIARHKPVVVVEIQGGHSFDNAPADVRAEIVTTIQLLESMGYYVIRLSRNDYLGFPLAEAFD